MELFAKRYLHCNPGHVLDNTGQCVCECTANHILTHTDTAYVLSYAIIMLHTSIYNPSVRDKPTVDSFVRMNRGINNGSDLPRDFLEV